MSDDHPDVRDAHPSTRTPARRICPRRDRPMSCRLREVAEDPGDAAEYDVQIGFVVGEALLRDRLSFGALPHLGKSDCELSGRPEPHGVKLSGAFVRRHFGVEFSRRRQPGAETDQGLRTVRIQLDSSAQVDSASGDP